MDKTKAICEYLRRHHVGKENAIHSRGLEKMFLLDGRSIRRKISALRQEGAAICSDEAGYYFADNQKELNATITRQLYQNSSIAVQGYEKTDLPDSFFDVAIGNVPFGQFKIPDRRYDKHNFLIHDYFFARTLDKVRPGGIIAFITSKGTMDKETPNVRKYIAQRPFRAGDRLHRLR